MKAELNLFYHSPKELVTDGFLSWMFYYLDSNEKYLKEKQILFSELLLEENERGNEIGKISVIRQYRGLNGRVDMILDFEMDGKMNRVLFENKTWTTTSNRQLSGYKIDHPNCYKYVFLKLAYANYLEKKICNEVGYEIIEVHKLIKSLEKIKHLHDFIAHYSDFLTQTYQQLLLQFNEKLLKNNDTSLLSDAQAQAFIIDKIYEEIDGKFPYILYKQGSSYGRPWTEIDFCTKFEVYGTKQEYIFWRLDIRKGQYYIRLNQYAEGISDDYRDLKKQKLLEYRSIANDIVKHFDLKPGKLSNRGRNENEIIIFFLNENKLQYLINVLPSFSLRFHEKYFEV